MKPVHRPPRIRLPVRAGTLGASFACALTLIAAGAAQAATVTFAPAADAYVNQAQPNTKYGSAMDLQIAAAPGERRSYLRFDVTNLAGSVVRATLHLSPNTVSTAYDVRGLTSDKWEERTIRWGNAPGVASTVLGSSSLAADGWTSTDVTGLVAGNGSVNLALTASGLSAVALASREATTRAPRLVVETADPADTTPPAVTLTQPANGSSTTDTLPTFSGGAGTATGDSATVTLRLYQGTAATGTPLQTLTATRSGSAWSRQASSALAVGTYTARAEQADTAGNLGQSSANTFSVTAPPPPPPTGSFRDAVMADGPVGYWRLGEPSGTSAASQTGTNAGAYSGGPALGRPGAITGDANTSVALDGVDDTVWVSSAASLNPTGALSLEAFVKPDSLPSGTATIVRKDGQYLLRLTGSGGLIFRLWKGGQITELTTPANLVRTGAWSHVVATFNGTTMAVYVNGSQRAQGALAGPIDAGTSGLYLGASTGSYDWLQGGLDEVAIYPSALSASRVAAHSAAAALPVAGPSVRLDSPAAGSTLDATPTYGGSAGTGSGDSATVTVKLYQGSAASGTPLQSLTAQVQPAGTFSVKTSTPLASGTYTAQAEQTNSSGGVGRSTASTFTVDAQLPPTLLSAGDIAACDTSGDEATAALLDRLPGTVATAGDHVYEYGTASDFTNCYDPTWGRHKARTRPAVGDHEYLTPNGTPYFNYFGSAAGDPAKGYYSYDIGTWHVVSMNATCEEIGGCDAGSPEEQWLRQDLQAHPAACTLAMIHKPRFSSGSVHGSQPAFQPFWQALYEYGAEVVLSGDDHEYERFAPQTPAGALDTARGIRQFVIGTGGRSHYDFGQIEPNSQARNNDTFGILRLSLRAGAYDWQFVPEAGKTFTDTGTTSCH